MRIVLFSMPSYYYEQSQGVPRLVSYLKKRGHAVVQKNLNYDYFKTICTKEWLSYVYNETRNKKVLDAFFGFEGRVSFFNKVAHAAKELDTYYLSLPYLKFKNNIDIVQEGLKYISAAYKGMQITLSHGIAKDGSVYSSKSLLNTIKDTRNNPIVAFYEKCVLPWLLIEKPDIVGISMTHMNQFIPGFTLCSLIKQKTDIHCTLGGMAVTHAARFLCKQPELNRLFDSIAIGAGEYTLDMLLSEYHNKKIWGKIPNFIYKKGHSFRESGVTRSFNINEAETPEYLELRTNPIITLETSQYCYWGKCAFCHWPKMYNHAYISKKTAYNEREIDKVIDDLIKLKKKYNPYYIRFSDSTVSPRRLDEILTTMKKQKQDMNYYAYIRAEPEFKEECFCADLQSKGLVATIFGLETGSQRINDLYCKGTSLKDAVLILKNFKKVGVIANLFCMVEFPQETADDLLRTASFLRKNAVNIEGAIHIARFALLYNTDAYHKKRRYGIYGIKAFKGHDLPLGYTYKVKGEKDLLLKRKISNWVINRYSSFADKFILKVIQNKNG